MTDDASARLGLPYLAAGQLQKHITLNEALSRLDALVQSAVESRTTAVAPTSPQPGALYILPAGASGAGWAGRPAGTLMRADHGGWIEVETPVGMLVVVLDAEELVARSPEGWVEIGGGDAPTELQNLTRLGVNTMADAVNVFAAKVNKALWAALGSGEGGDGDLRFTFNKQAAGNVLSLLFQSNWGGRAELGLIGDDDLRMKVSPDGGTWREALSVDRHSGRVTFPVSPLRRETITLTDDGTYMPPPWACWVEAMALGAGGAGDDGRAGTDRSLSGGAGGQAGDIVRQTWPADLLTSGVRVAIGRGGQSGADGGDTVIDVNDARLLRAPGGQGGAALSLLNLIGTRASVDPDRPGDGGAGGGIDGSGRSLTGSPGEDGAAMAMIRPDLSPAGGGGRGGASNPRGAGRDGEAGRGPGAGGGGGGAGLDRAGAGGSGADGAVVFTAVG